VGGHGQVGLLKNGFIFPILPSLAAVKLTQALLCQRAPTRESIPSLEWEAHDAVDPFFRFHRAPDEEQILNDVPSREALRYQDHTGTRMLADECRKMPGHRPDIVRQ
jgi:hypothetical protein